MEAHFKLSTKFTFLYMCNVVVKFNMILKKLEDQFQNIGEVQGSGQYYFKEVMKLTIVYLILLLNF
jgi:hypothetical protein